MMKQKKLWEYGMDKHSGATFSECKKYRYVLWRIWDHDLPKCMFIGLNPSTANEEKDDATIRRVKSLAKEWGFGGIYMLNCFPYISTNPDDLKDFGNTATNDHHLIQCSKVSDAIIFAWGSFKIVKELGRDKELIGLFPHAKAIIVNKDGSPRHPLYIKSGLQPILFAP